MISLELLAYIEHEKTAKVSEAEIFKTLISQGGWTKSDIQEAISIANLPKGSIQAAQFRAARLRSETQTKAKHSFFGKIITFLFLVGIIGCGIAYFMSSSETQKNVLSYLQALPTSIQNEYVPNFMTWVKGDSVNFADNFKLCQPATTSLTVSGYTTKFIIVEKKPNVCVVNEQISGPSLTTPQTLTCQFTETDWNMAQTNSSRVCRPIFATN